MNLLRLTANQASFRQVSFKPNGITLILGKRKTADTKKDETYNGVGKSLLVYLVNFCFGSQAKEELAHKLPDWAFTLEFKIGADAFNVTRATADQENVLLNGVKTSLEDYKAWLGPKLFAFKETIPFLTFRSLIGLFLRPGKHAYDNYDRLQYSEIPYQRLIRNAFLLGIETGLIHEKFVVRQALEQTTEMNARFSKDPIICDYFLGNKDVNIDLKELEDSLRKLENDYAEFKVAENYKDIESQANEKRRAIQALRNEVYSLEGLIDQIEQSLTQNAHVSKARIEELYKEAGITLPTLLVKKLQEVEEFHEQLVKSREARLKTELRKQQLKLKSTVDNLSALNAELNAKLKFLGSHGAFSEYTALSERVSEKRAEVQKLRDFKRLTKEYKDKIRELKLQLSEGNIRASKYLEENEAQINHVTDIFRAYCKRLYPGKKSALIITNNEGDNQTRFDIEAKIISDSSDGINEVKIFCFDATILLAKQNHHVNFLFHDSRLFSDIDPRQRTEIFRIAAEFASTADTQYIATLNEDQTETMKQWFTEQEFKQIISDNVVLALTDESPSEKLLGIDVDLDYN
jgi:uncharacterized protein YydD (DUF2326 family)